MLPALLHREIFNDSAGRYLVRTSTGSEHLVTARGNRRIARKMAGVAPALNFLHVQTSEPRRDEDELDLLLLEICRVGSPALFRIQA